MILVTGGAGYIGTHVCCELLSAGYNLVVLDNLSNSSIEALHRVAKVCTVKLNVVEPSFNHDFERFLFVRGDIGDKDLVQSVFSIFDIEAVVHLAGFKSVSESLSLPLLYYRNNVIGSLVLLDVMSEFNCKRLVFSSSATVYGDSLRVPITEDFPIFPTNPYGSSKVIVEDVLRDLAKSDNGWSIAVLRYFNPVGAHVSGLIGEDPRGVPNNLMPYVSQVAVGLRESLVVYGSDYPTKDGTGVRDYIHVVDLAKGHIKALELFPSNGFCTFNLGTGEGYSVLEVVAAFERAAGRKIPVKISARRAGDVAQCFADPSHSNNALRWFAEYDLDRMCEDAWRWQSLNPNGYSGGD